MIGAIRWWLRGAIEITEEGAHLAARPRDADAVVLIHSEGQGAQRDEQGVQVQPTSVRLVRRSAVPDQKR
jgi:hypothetical protein